MFKHSHLPLSLTIFCTFRDTPTSSIISVSHVLVFTSLCSLKKKLTESFTFILLFPVPSLQSAI